MVNLTLALARAGLIQFGRFVQADDQIWPVALNLRWLPSYPALLRETAVALHPLLEGIEADRLLTTADALPIGVALSLHADLPLVYPYGEERDYTAAFVIEGAYDVGHPTLLLSDVLPGAAQADRVKALARRVGLDIHAILAVVDLGLGARRELESTGYSVRCVLSLHDVLPVLAGEGFLPPVMRDTVDAWLAAGAA